MGKRKPLRGHTKRATQRVAQYDRRDGKSLSGIRFPQIPSIIVGTQVKATNLEAVFLPDVVYAVSAITRIMQRCHAGQKPDIG